MSLDKLESLDLFYLIWILDGWRCFHLLYLVTNAVLQRYRGDRGLLEHGVQWDSPYIGNSNKENAIMKLSNKCQGSHPSFCFLSRRHLNSYKAGEEKLLFRPKL